MNSFNKPSFPSFLEYLLLSILNVFVWFVGLRWLYFNFVSWNNAFIATPQPYGLLLTTLMTAFVMLVSLLIAGAVAFLLLAVYIHIKESLSSHTKSFLSGVCTTLFIILLAASHIWFSSLLHDYLPSLKHWPAALFWGAFCYIMLLFIATEFLWITISLIADSISFLRALKRLF